ncbi:MAG: hypothetical protein MUC97_12810 [Bernardetiaceae bacterium]|jgi:hypothetical protein|nr:hypothetical protein [Bernardetiaceae bacterium]
MKAKVIKMLMVAFCLVTGAPDQLSVLLDKDFAITPEAKAGPGYYYVFSNCTYYTTHYAPSYSTGYGFGYSNPGGYYQVAHSGGKCTYDQTRGGCAFASSCG